MKVEYKAPAELSDEQREALRVLNELRPGYKNAVHGALHVYMGTFTAIDRYPQRRGCTKGGDTLYDLRNH